MVIKSAGSEKKRLIVIQFLDKEEGQTGYVLSKNVLQSSPYIGNVDFFSSSNKDDILKFINIDIPELSVNDNELGIYIDTHGFSKCDGIGHRNDFISWEELVAALKKSFENREILPIIILTACNGISIKSVLDNLKRPICSKLYAGDGVMLNGPVMGAFTRLFNEYGLEFGVKEIESINIDLANRNNPPFVCVDYLK